MDAVHCSLNVDSLVAGLSDSYSILENTLEPPVVVSSQVSDRLMYLQRPDLGRQIDAAERLEKYAQVFHTVEGNTTFYATPTLNTVQNWRAATHDDFRFTFKLPKAITHEQMLRDFSTASG